MFLAVESGPKVSIVAEHLFNVGPLSVTNSMLYGSIGTLVLLGLLWRTVRHVKARNYDYFTLMMLWVYETLLNTVEEVMGDREAARKLAPLAITMFFVITINNWMGLLPFVGPLTYNGEPLFRGLASDLNFTAGLAVITMVTAQVWAVKAHGFFGNLGRYFVNPFKDGMGFFVGFLEIVSEFSRLIALAMRLFGNVFGGEVLLLVMGFITMFAAPIALPPFMLLELFVGAIQAYVFFMLTVVFTSLAMMSHHEPSPSSESSQPIGGLAGEVVV
jgi:F-type H+-transporting ATPase subunit a